MSILGLIKRLYHKIFKRIVEIFEARFTIGTIKFDNDNFYKRLREKLFWGQDMRNQNLNK